MRAKKYVLFLSGNLACDHFTYRADPDNIEVMLAIKKKKIIQYYQHLQHAIINVKWLSPKTRI